MLIILASSNDRVARDLAVRWPRTLLLTPQDLSRRGWRYEVPVPPGSARGERAESAVAAGAVIRAADIAGVYTRLPGVFEYELPEIRIEDKEYVAAEMNAFLLSWLTSLPCTVLNRPTIMGLAGPNLRPEAWTRVAAELDIPVRSTRRGSDGYQPHATPKAEQLSVVGGACFGDVDPLARRWARTLADHMGLVLLTVAFERSAGKTRFLEAHPWLDLTIPGVEDALRDLLCVPGAQTHLEAT